MRVGIIGDSQGVGLVRLGGLARALQARGDTITDTMLVTGMGLRGMRASSSRVSRARAVARSADVLIVILGGNNTYDRQRYRTALDWFFREVVRTGQKVIWVGPANSPGVPYHQQTRAFQKEYFAHNARVKWVDPWHMTTGLPMTQGRNPPATANIHFTVSGYAEWVRRLVPELGFVKWASILGAAILGSAVGIFLALRRR